MTRVFDDRSNQMLRGVHPDLVRVMRASLAAAPFPFRITEGLRTIERQRQLVAKGASRTLKSRHLPHRLDGLSRAVDLVPLVDLDNDGKIETEELYHWPLYHKLAPVIKAEAARLGIAIVWGGDWRTFKDGPHWELDRRVYPA